MKTSAELLAFIRGIEASVMSRDVPRIRCVDCGTQRWFVLSDVKLALATDH